MGNHYTPERAMAIYAHPDDIEFSCAGTLARWASEGCKNSYVIITSGDVGITDPHISREEARKIRESEAQAAAEIAGATEVIFLGEPDGILQPSLEIRERLVREIRRFKPEVVICSDPSIIIASDTYINHPDHRAAATLALEAVFPAAGQPNLFEEIELEHGYKAHNPRKVYVSSWENTTTFVNIETTIDIKIKALRAHKSQMEGWDPGPMIKEWAKDYAKGKEMTYAEGYRVISLVSDSDWEKCKGDPIKLLEARRAEQKGKQDEDGKEQVSSKAVE
ncbi:MAG: PIG-L deacetylase family protein [Anaerolineales bacterium]|jgi:LmbE family N-acetylglucosaminyl deacetylase